MLMKGNTWIWFSSIMSQARVRSTCLPVCLYACLVASWGLILHLWLLVRAPSLKDRPRAPLPGLGDSHTSQVGYLYCTLLHSKAPPGSRRVWPPTRNSQHRVCPLSDQLRVGKSGYWVIAIVHMHVGRAVPNNLMMPGKKASFRVSDIELNWALSRASRLYH